jgi:hypothetical protein
LSLAKQKVNVVSFNPNQSLPDLQLTNEMPPVNLNNFFMKAVTLNDLLVQLGVLILPDLKLKKRVCLI